MHWHLKTQEMFRTHVKLAFSFEWSLVWVYPLRMVFANFSNRGKDENAMVTEKLPLFYTYEKNLPFFCMLVLLRVK